MNRAEFFFYQHISHLITITRLQHTRSTITNSIVVWGEFYSAEKSVNDAGASSSLDGALAHAGFGAVLAFAAITAGFADGNHVNGDSLEIHADLNRLMTESSAFVFLEHSQDGESFPFRSFRLIAFQLKRRDKISTRLQPSRCIIPDTLYRRCFV